MSLMDEVAADIRAVIADLGFLRTQLDTALHDIERAGQGFARAGHGTTADQLPQAVTACAEAAERLVAAMDVIDRGRELLWNYLLVITPSMAGPSPTAAPVTTSPATLQEQPEPAPYIGSFLEGLRTRSRRREPTDGVLTTTDGQRVAAVYSGRRGPATGGAGLRPMWGQANAAVIHAEGHAAALIRARGLTDATLYVNDRPCPGPMGCDEALPGLLPLGTTLTVYGPGGFVKVYQGAGEHLT